MEESTIFVNGSKFKAKKKLKLFERTAYLITGSIFFLNFIKKVKRFRNTVSFILLDSESPKARHMSHG